MHRFAILTLGALASVSGGGLSAANEVVINRDSGQILWKNSTGQALDVAAYTLQSKLGGFDPTNWLSITENYDADSGGTLDPDSTWFVLGSDALNLSEATIGVTTLVPEDAVNLGIAWIPHSVEDVTFEYLDVGLDEVLPGSVQYIDDIPGDYNANGVVEQSDLDLVLLHWGQPALPVPEGWFNDLPLGLIDQAELDGVLLNWGAGGKVSAQPLLRGLFAASVPEPSVLSLGACCGAAICVLAMGRVRAAARPMARTSSAVPSA
jgi:hypothetical protein